MWVRLPLPSILWQLDRIYGDLGAHAEQFFTNFVEPARRRGVHIGPASGRNYADTNAFTDRRMLALQLFYDAVVTVRNALGRAAQATRKYNVLSIRICNVPACMRDADCILPIAIVPPAAWDKYGFDGVAEALLPDFELVYRGTRACMHCLFYISFLCVNGDLDLYTRLVVCTLR